MSREMKVFLSVWAGFTVVGAILGLLIGAATDLSGSTYQNAEAVGVLIGTASGMGMGLVMGPIVAWG